MYKEIINTSHKLSTKKYKQKYGKIQKSFLTIPRQEAGYRPIHDRISDYSEVEQTLNSRDRKLQLHAAWTAVFLSATGLVRWATSNPNFRTPSTKANGKKPTRY